LMEVLREFTATREAAVLRGSLPDPAFSDFEDPDYGTFFRRASALLRGFEEGRSSAREAAGEVFRITADYEFPVALSLEAMRRAGWVGERETISERSIRFAREGYRWAITNPTTRDLFGNSETLYRWRARYPDPHLEDAGSSRESGP